MKKRGRASTNAEGWRNPHTVSTPAAGYVERALLLGDSLRRKVASGRALGTFSIEMSSPASITALALAGFDFVVLDMEHSTTDLGSLEPLILAAQAAGMAALVRPCSESIGVIGKILDMGAHGIMAPHIDSADSARRIVEQTRFPPRGRRGFSPLSRFDALDRPLSALDRATYLVVQVEGRAALEHIDQIAAVPGIDAVFVGPYDLALSLDVPPNSPQVAIAARRAAKSVPANVSMGIYVDDPATSTAWAERRFALQCVSFDGRMFANAARAVVKQARGASTTRRTRR